MKFNYWSFILLLSILLLLFFYAIKCWFRGGKGRARTEFDNCRETTIDGCGGDSSETCVHYTCDSPEDAARINENNIKLTCGADNVLKCENVGATTYCECAPKN